LTKEWQMTKLLAMLLLSCGLALGQEQQPQDQPQLKSRTELPKTPEEPVNKQLWIVPAGAKVPVRLRQAISTKHAQPGDTVYGQTAFPVLADQNVAIPDGTYVQGVIDSVRRAGHVKGTAELQFHITTLIYPNGYTLDMAAAVDQVPGDSSSHMKEPGVVQHDSEKGADAERIARGAAEGAGIGGMAGAVSGSLKGVGIGGLAGIAAGALVGVLARGSDVRFETGTVVDVVLNHAIGIDQERVLRGATLPASSSPQTTTPPATSP
jgi:hypothetical protein